MQDLAGKIAFITGASRGIGRAAALALGARGATVAIGYRKEAETARDVVAEIERLGGHGAPVQLDVGDPAQRDPVTTAVRELGKAIRDHEQLLSTMLPCGDGLLLAVKR